MTTTELKILCSAARKIKEKPYEFPRVSFNLREFMEEGGVNNQKTLNNIENIANELIQRRIVIHHENEFKWYLWLQSLEIDNGILHLKFNPIIQSER